MNNKTITNGEKIRLLTDLELAKIIAADFMSEIIPFCKSTEKCNEMLDSGKDIPEEMCIECALRWLNEEAEENEM